MKLVNTCINVCLFVVTITGFKVIINDLQVNKNILMYNNSILLELKESQTTMQKQFTEIERNIAVLKLQQVEPEDEETNTVPEF